MPCTTNKDLTVEQKSQQQQALERLKAALAAGRITAVVGANGALAFKGWALADRRGVSDVCAYRAIANTPEMRRALVKAEAVAGRKVSLIAVATGIHSHDDGQTWHSGH